MSANEAYFAQVGALAPELVLLLTAFVALLTRRRAARTSWIALAGLAVTAALLVVRARDAAKPTFALLEVDRFAAFFQLVMTAATAVVIVSWASARRALAPRAGFLLLTALLGGFVMVETNHALVFVLGLELSSLASHALAGCDASRPQSSEAALKHAVFSGFSTALSIYGLSLLYGLSGTLDFARMGATEAASGAPSLAAQLAQGPLPVALALLLVLAGIASKLALAPLHFVAPDVGDGAPTPVAAFFVVVAKVAAFGALLRILAALFVQDHAAHGLSAFEQRLGGLLALLSAVTLAIGSLAALRPVGLKRLLAYSSIAHTGFATIGAACLDETGFAAALVFLALSTLAHAGAFVIVVVLEDEVGSEQLADLRGLGKASPVVAGALLVLLASLVGLPPLAGFYGKYRVFLEAWNAGFGWLVLGGAAATLLGISVLLRVASALFFEPAPGRAPLRRRALSALAVALALVTLILGLCPGGLDRWAAQALDLLR